MIRVSVHYQTLQQCFIIRSNKDRNKAIMATVPLSVAIRSHNGVIICHSGKISTFAVQIFHNSLGHLGRLQGILIKVLSFPVFKSLSNYLCHSLIIILVKRNEQICFVLNLLRVIAFLPDDADCVVVNVTWEIGTIRLPIVVGSKCSANFVE